MSDNNSKKLQNHHLRQEQLSELQEAQQAETAEQSKYDGKSYKVAAHEQHLVHALIWIPQFNSTTGRDEAVRRVQMFDVQKFAQMQKDNNFAGYRVEILHEGNRKVNYEKLTLNVTPQAANISDVQARPLVKANDELPEMAIKDMDTKRLREEYHRYYNEPAPADFTDEELRVDIKEKIAFIEEEKKRAIQNNPATTTAAANTTAANVAATNQPNAQTSKAEPAKGEANLGQTSTKSTPPSSEDVKGK
jgi:hypothetical protein